MGVWDHFQNRFTVKGTTCNFKVVLPLEACKLLYHLLPFSLHISPNFNLYLDFIKRLRLREILSYLKLQDVLEEKKIV